MEMKIHTIGAAAVGTSGAPVSDSCLMGLSKEEKKMFSAAGSSLGLLSGFFSSSFSPGFLSLACFAFFFLLTFFLYFFLYFFLSVLFLLPLAFFPTCLLTLLPTSPARCLLAG